MAKNTKASKKLLYDSPCVNGGRAKHYSEVLSRTELLSSFSADDKLHFLSYANECRFSKDECIFSEDDLSNSMYVVIDGEVVIEKGTGRTAQQLARYAKHDIFGESGLFLSLARGARANAVGRTILLRFPAESISLADIMNHNPVFCNRMFNILINHVAHRIRSVNGLIGESKRWVNTLREQLIIDKLTGLYNAKSYSEEFLPQLINKESVVAVVLKPRNFKTVNDGYGHEIGDAVLHKLGSLFRGIIKGEGLAFRYMGSEFAFLFYDDNDRQEKIDMYIKKLLDAIAQLDFVALGVDPNLRLSCMYDVMRYPDECSDLSVLLEKTHLRFMKSFSRE